MTAELINAPGQPCPCCTPDRELKQPSEYQTNVATQEAYEAAGYDYATTFGPIPPCEPSDSLREPERVTTTVELPRGIKLARHNFLTWLHNRKEHQ